MALVSEGIGMKEADATSVFIKQLMILLAQAIRDEKKQGYIDEHMKGAKTILKHIRSGGKTAYQTVDAVDAAVFEKLLQSQRVTYVRLQEIDGKVSFVTRDCDKAQMEKVWELFAAELKIAFQEQTPHEFIHDNANQNVCQALGYTEAEVEVFRRQAVEIGFTYSVVAGEEPGLFDILYAERDKDFATKALKAVEYEFSGEAGQEYKEKLEQSLAVKNQVLAQAKQKKPVYLVNAHNPMQFLRISDGMLTRHTLSLEESKGRDGAVEHIVKDKTERTYPFGNRELTQAMKAYGKCKMVPKEAMDFIKGFDSAGNALVTDTKELEQALKAIDQMTAVPLYEIDFGRKEALWKEPLCTLSGLAVTDLMEVTKALDKERIGYTVVGRDMAYSAKDRAKVEQILNKTLYQDMDYLERFQTMVYYEKRGPEKLDLKNRTEPVYIASAVNSEFVLKLDKEGYTLLQNGEPILAVSEKDPQFSSNLEQMLDSMEDIAVLTAKEAEQSPEERVQLIAERAALKENAASGQYRGSYDEQKERFLSTDYEAMTPEEKALMHQYMAHEIVTTKVDRFYRERLGDREFGSRIREQKQEKSKDNSKKKNKTKERGKENDRLL
ncbi:MAG: hypothetical protein J6J44_05435 [Lachnospiraceae bacterium]|nr:hypothetical protein [Lachnospiraceae bacterium]